MLKEKPAFVPKALFQTTWGRSSDLRLGSSPSHPTGVGQWHDDERIGVYSSGNCPGLAPDSLLSLSAPHIGGKCTIFLFHKEKKHNFPRKYFFPLFC